METPSSPDHSIIRSPYKIGGALLILIGFLLGLDQVLKTGWLTFVVFPLSGLIMIYLGVNSRSFGWLIAGSIVLGLGAVGYFLLGQLAPQPFLERLGKGLILFGGSWLLITLLSAAIHHPPAWWALVPGGVIIGFGYSLARVPVRVLDFVLFVSCGLAISLLIWGMAARLFGLIIPGSLILSIGPGIYFSWRDLIDLNALAQTGVMLVWFAFGWGLITILARRIYGKFVWWPLIPGGILAVTGWGLYIGGDPGNALGFIGNTGSIAMLVFGLYLLLMRKGIHR
jgi:hypothetical protein